MAEKQSLAVAIISTEKIIYSGEAKAITSTNERGKFDVLPLHANFISIIKEFITIHEHSGKKQEIKIDSGIIRVSKNQVEIFLGMEVLTA